MHEKQKHAVNRDPWVEEYLGKGLTGRSFAKGEFDRFIDEHYDPSRTRWFDRLAHKWNQTLIAVRTPHSAAIKGEELKRVIGNGDYIKLRDEYQIRYLVTDAAKDLESENGSIKSLYGDSKVKLYELRPE